MECASLRPDSRAEVCRADNEEEAPLFIASLLLNGRADVDRAADDDGTALFISSRLLGRTPTAGSSSETVPMSGTWPLGRSAWPMSSDVSGALPTLRLSK